VDDASVFDALTSRDLVRMPLDMALDLVHGQGDPNTAAALMRQINAAHGFAPDGSDAPRLAREHDARLQAQWAQEEAAYRAWQAQQQTPKAIAARRRAEEKERELMRYNDRQRELAANPPPAPFDDMVQ
jgi:hypothetical protein